MVLLYILLLGNNMELLYYVVTPSENICNAVVEFDVTSDFGTEKQRKTISLDQLLDLQGKANYTDEDVASAITVKVSTKQPVVITPFTPKPDVSEITGS